ncbi:MAG: hypothetical protein ACRD4P_18075, partial [Bryobacteraceae bacterium]
CGTEASGIDSPPGPGNVTPAQFPGDLKILDVVCLQNFYNTANRRDDRFIEDLAKQGIAYVPFSLWEGSRC